MQLKEVSAQSPCRRTRLEVSAAACIEGRVPSGALLLFEEVPVDLKLLLEHDLAPVLNNERVWIQVLGGSENLSMSLDTCDASQLELQTDPYKSIHRGDIIFRRLEESRN